MREYRLRLEPCNVGPRNLDRCNFGRGNLDGSALNAAFYVGLARVGTDQPAADFLQGGDHLLRGGGAHCEPRISRLSACQRHLRQHADIFEGERELQKVALVTEAAEAQHDGSWAALARRERDGVASCPGLIGG